MVPATTIKEEWALMSKPSIVILDGGWDAIHSEIVLEPLTKVHKGWREMRIPSLVAAGLLAEMVVPAFELAEGFCVSV